MSLGNTYNNNQNKDNRPEVTVYSAYRMNNHESSIDPTCITFRFWKNTLCVGIFPRKNTNNDEVAFDMDNGITIYLSHTKARILKAELENFIKDPVAYNGAGVPSGSAVISISNGAEYGKNAPIVTIRKVDENGRVVSSFAYEFKRNYHFSIRGYTGQGFDKVFDDYNNIEIEQFITLLDEYCKAMTNAVAYTVMDQRKYSHGRVENKIDAIAKSLGVETNQGSGNRRSYNNSSYFNNAGGNQSSSSSNGGYSSNVGYGSASIEDLED